MADPRCFLALVLLLAAPAAASTETVVDHLPQLPPQDVQGTWKDDVFRITWEAPPMGTDAVLTAYEVYRVDPLNTSMPVALLASLDPTVTRHEPSVALTDKVLFYVVAVNDHQESSPPSTPVSPVPYPPCVPVTVHILPPPPTLDDLRPECLDPTGEFSTYVMTLVSETIP